MTDRFTTEPAPFGGYTHAMVRAAGVTAWVVACLFWCSGCAERTLAVYPLYGRDAGGPGGAGGGGGDGGHGEQKMGEPCPASTRGNTCVASYACWKTCGPARSGFRNCSCDVAGALSCTAACLYERGQNLSCFALPDPVPSCPASNSVDAATQLPQATAACQLDPCRPCGSSTEPGYIDAAGAPRVGYCVCVPNPDTGVS